MIDTTENTDIDELVAAGVAWLDGPEGPADWWNLVNLIGFDMKNQGSCLLARLAQATNHDDHISYWEALGYSGLSVEDGQNLGFELAWPDDRWGDLNEAWKQVILSRRQEQ